MAFNDLKRRNSSYFAFFTEFDCFAGQLRTVVEGRPIKPTLQRVLSAIAELLVIM